MSKVEKVENPFAQFNIIQGKIIPPDNLEDESEIKTGDETVIKENLENLENDDSLEQGTKLIEENIKKAEAIKKAKEKAKEGEIVETVANTEEQEELEETNSDEVVEVSAFKGYANELYQKGVIDFDAEDEDFVESEEGVEILINKTVENRINKWANSLPQEYNDFLSYVKAGGNPKDFLDVYYGETSWKDFNVEDSTESQKYAIRESLTLAGESPEDIEEIIADWEAKADGTLEKRAKSAINKLQKHQEAEKAALLKIQQEKAEETKRVNQAYMDNFKKSLYDKDDIMGFKLTPKLKDKLWDYMTVIDKKTGKTAYQEAIEKNQESSLLFALQAMQGFNLSALEKQVQNKVNGNLSKLLKNVTKETKTKISGGTTQEHQDEDPFSAFRQAKI